MALLTNAMKVNEEIKTKSIILNRIWVDRRRWIAQPTPSSSCWAQNVMCCVIVSVCNVIDFLFSAWILFTCLLGRDSQPYIFVCITNTFFIPPAQSNLMFSFFFLFIVFLTVSSRLFPKTKSLHLFQIHPCRNHAFIVVASSVVNRWSVFIKFTIHNNNNWKKCAQFTWKSNLLEQYWCWWMSIITFDSIALPYCCDHCKVGSAWVFFFMLLLSFFGFIYECVWHILMVRIFHTPKSNYSTANLCTVTYNSTAPSVTFFIADDFDENRFSFSWILRFFIEKHTNIHPRISINPFTDFAWI